MVWLMTLKNGFETCHNCNNKHCDRCIFGNNGNPLKQTDLSPVPLRIKIIHIGKKNLLESFPTIAKRESLYAIQDGIEDVRKIISSFTDDRSP